MVKIRLTRMGASKKPFYRIIVADSKARRDGPFIEMIGTYDPKREPSEIKIKLDRAEYWISKGAQPTERVRKLLEIVKSKA
ncbi:MAG: 30S ribosomal protein S16 [Thermodesulfovibrionales bacterium]|nr:30S ribosomal protein S16 [Thermodesulfovibrionales bacterium]